MRRVGTGEPGRGSIEGRPVGRRTARLDQSSDRWWWHAGHGASDLVGASGFEPTVPTSPWIVVPIWLASALNEAA